MTDSDTFNGMHPEHGAIHVLGGEVQDATSIYVVAARSMVQRRLLGSAHHQQYEEAYGHSFSLVEMAPEWREHFQLEYERARLEALDEPDAFTTDELFGLNLFGLIRPPTAYACKGSCSRKQAVSTQPKGYDDADALR